MDWMKATPPVITDDTPTFTAWFDDGDGWRQLTSDPAAINGVYVSADRADAALSVRRERYQRWEIRQGDKVVESSATQEKYELWVWLYFTDRWVTGNDYTDFAMALDAGRIYVDTWKDDGLPTPFAIIRQRDGVILAMSVDAPPMMVR